MIVHNGPELTNLFHKSPNDALILICHFFCLTSITQLTTIKQTHKNNQQNTDSNEANANKSISKIKLETAIQKLKHKHKKNHMKIVAKVFAENAR